MSLVLLPLVTTWLTSFKRALEERPFQKQPPTTELQRSRCESSQQHKPPPPHHFLRDKRLQCLCLCRGTRGGTAIGTVSLAARAFQSPPCRALCSCSPRGRAVLSSRDEPAASKAAALACLPSWAILQRLSWECVSRGAQEASLSVPLTSHRRGALGQMVLVPAEASLGLHSASGTSSRGCS